MMLDQLVSPRSDKPTADNLRKHCYCLHDRLGWDFKGAIVHQSLHRTNRLSLFKSPHFRLILNARESNC